MRRGWSPLAEQDVVLVSHRRWPSTDDCFVSRIRLKSTIWNLRDDEQKALKRHGLSCLNCLRGRHLVDLGFQVIVNGLPRGQYIANHVTPTRTYRQEVGHLDGHLMQLVIAQRLKVLDSIRVGGILRPVGSRCGEDKLQHVQGKGRPVFQGRGR